MQTVTNTASGEVTTFTYDADGQRVKRDIMTDTIVYVGSHCEARFKEQDIPEDVDDDCDVDIVDIMQVVSRWGTSCDNPDPDNNPATNNYDPLYDLDGDCDIDIVDIMRVAAHWRETCERPTDTVKYYWLGGRRVAMRRKPVGQEATLYYLFTDHLGSTSVVYDTSNSTWTTQRYYPYGGTRSGEMPTDRLFTGQRFDGTIGLYDYGARWYDPALGRFVQADTLVPQPGNPQALNRYAYTLNNPLRYTDPSGHWFESLIDIISIGYDLYDISQHGLTWENGLALVADVASLALPAVTGGGMMVRAAAHVDDVADVARAVNTATNVAQAANQADNVIDALERVRQVGKWVQRNESMSEAARAYQRFISGRTDDLVFQLGDYTFDNFDAIRGVLQDAKNIPGHFVDPLTHEFKPWVSGTADWLMQARNQVGAAGGVRIEWYFNSDAARDAMYKLFLEQDPELLKYIELIYKPIQ